MELLDDKMRIWIDSAKFVKPVPGVYILYDKNKEPIYIGETDNLEETFTKYVDQDFEEDGCKKETALYQREFSDNPKERRTQLIEDFKGRYGRLPVCNSKIRVETQ